MSRGYIHSTPTFLDGLYLVVNAVPGTHLLIDCPGCGVEKPGKTGMAHDLSSTLLRWDHSHRAHYSGLHATDIVLGSDAKLEAKIRSIVARSDPDLILLTQSSIVLLMGTDINAISEALEEELGVRLPVVSSQTLSGDYLQGFSGGLTGVARGLELEASPRKGTVGIIGYPMDRGEEDHRGNLRELRRMVEALDLELAPVFPSGAPLSDLDEIARAERLLAFPAGIDAAEHLGAGLGVEVHRCALPIGLAGTTGWLRTVGDLFDRSKQAERFIQAELAALVPRLELPVRRFTGLRIACAASPDMSPGLVTFVDELGMSLASVIVRTRNAAGAEPTRDALRSTGQEVSIETDPTFLGVEERWRSIRDERGLDLIVGSGNERDAGKALDLPFLELGYPCFVRHAISDAPWLGYRGAAWIADALFNLLNEWAYLRY